MKFELKKYTPPDFNLPVFQNAPDADLKPAPNDFAAPEGFHATSIFPEYFKVDGAWLLAEDSRMDCAAVWDGQISVREFRHIKKGDLIFTGRGEDGKGGIYLHTDGFHDKGVSGFDEQLFSFRQGRSRETAFSMDYDYLYQLLEYERKNGYVVWVMGPACSFDSDSREAFSKLVSGGYVDALLAGNALVVHDLEGSYKKTALGQDIYTQRRYPDGHYNHLDTINRVRLCGSVKAFLERENIRDGIISGCARHNIPVVLTGSIRDDGPLPEVLADVYAGQDAMREHIRKATTIICLATTLHAIAAGNMAPSFRVMPDGRIRQLYFYTVDISEFAVNKLGDRGSLAAKSIVTNVQDFIVNVSKGLAAGYK
jgi:hypothetical protein